MELPKLQAIPEGARRAVLVLTALNLLNYVDRYVPSAVKDLIKTDLGLTDDETSYPLSAFVIVYMLASPVVGSLADRYPRRVVIASGVALWSLATAAAAFATGFWTLLIARAFVGIGEAAYATLSPAWLSDYYPPDRRNKVLTVFYVAIPVGSAIGFGLGGYLGQEFGWRAAFLIVGLPGVLAALAVLTVRDPGRGTFDTDKSEVPPTWRQALPELLGNRQYAYAVGGYVLVTFASGALADWFPTFLSRQRGMDLAEAGTLVGGATVVGGLGGTVLGGFLGDWLKGKTRQPYLALSGITMVIASGLAVLAFEVEGKLQIGLLIAGAQLFMWCYNAPINAILVNSVSSGLRVRAFALSILLIHVLGDAISPPIVGIISRVTGDLHLGLLLVPITMAASGIVWAIGWRVLPEPPAGARPGAAA